jgi:hypothetical protein
MNALNIGKTIHIIRWICKRLRRETVPPPNTVPAVLCKASARPQRNIPFFEGFSKIGNRNGNITTFTLSIEPVSALSLTRSLYSNGYRLAPCSLCRVSKDLGVRERGFIYAVRVTERSLRAHLSLLT